MMPQQKKKHQTRVKLDVKQEVFVTADRRPAELADHTPLKRPDAAAGQEMLMLAVSWRK